MTARVCDVLAGAVLYVAGGALVWMLGGMAVGFTAAHGLGLGLALGAVSAVVGLAGNAARAAWLRRRRVAAAEAEPRG